MRNSRTKGSSIPGIGVVQFLLVVAPEIYRLATYQRDGANADDDDAGQQDCIFDRGRAVFTNQKLDDFLHDGAVRMR